MRSSIWLLAATALGVSAHPLQARNNSPWSPVERGYYKAVAERITLAERDPSFPNFWGSCDLSKAVMPASTLPPPDSGLKLKHVAIGRGTQNYTCADSTANSVPLAIGALATLYNASCFAADAPGLLALLPEFVLNTAIPGNFPNSGNHYFMGSSPVFNIIHPDLGSTTAKKLAACDAPSTATKGKGGNGFGSISWLKLGQVSGSPSMQNVYRLNTAGGSPPPNCNGMASKFEVAYSAEYWFFGVDS
ncbi:MAG: hypothetical protein M1839_003912 [Geoglossum umbratile]|nr:MAG: hypothetical protein M1839_003912 [Geoglossum umbratile]